MKKILNFCTKYKKWIISFCLVFAVAYPWIFRSGYLIRVGVNCLMYASISLSLNLIIGNLGQMSMGHAAFWGIGAYTSAILSTKLGMGSIGTLLVTIVVVAVFSFLLGMPVLKLKGYYMTVVTLGFCEIIRLVELNWTSLTRGALGISRIPSFTFFGHKVTNKIAIFYMALGMLVVTVLILQALINSKHGLAILAIRDDEIAAQSIGINMFYHKMIAFVIAGVIAGVNGAFYARFSSYIDSNLFNTGQSMNFAIFAIFGGLGNIAGVIGGTIFLTVLPEVLRFLSAYRTFLYGVLIIIVMLIKPEGILGNVNFKYIAQKQKMESEEKEGKV